MKILTVFTGGTIGSVVKNGIADVDISASKPLTDICSHYNNIEFEYISPFNILSENLTCGTLSQICSFMLSIDFNKYDGIIITHGSDTLAYTSAVLGMVLSFAKIPIVITAADYVLTSPRSNGKENFTASINFIKAFAEGNHRNTGVFTIWKNRGEAVKVYISTRINEADSYLDSFSSFGGAEFGIMQGEQFIRTDKYINPDCTKPCQDTIFLYKQSIIFNNKVLFLQSYPGLDFSAADISNKAAVLLKLYHSATACTVGESASFLKFAQHCFENNVDVYVYSAKKGEYIYKSAENMLSGNIAPLYNINTPAAYCKILLAYAVDKKHREEVIHGNLFYESLPQIH